jgi:hypothetical protein
MKILEHNVATGEVIERDATAEEIERRQVESEKQAEEEFLAAQRSLDKAALLERLGLTADEAALLIP